MAKERALDIFWLLGQLDRKNFNLWSELTEEQRKEVSPYVILRWLMGTDEPEQLIKLAELANSSLFDLADKKELMLMVLAASTVGGPKRYSWVTPKGAAKSGRAVQLIAQTYRMPLKHATDVRPLFAAADIVALAEAQGWQKDELKDLQKELG